MKVLSCLPVCELLELTDTQGMKSYVSILDLSYDEVYDIQCRHKQHADTRDACLVQG